MSFGPFSVDPTSIAALGGSNFATFVNRLLAVETAALGLSGTALETTYQENVGDGGVDAGLRSDVGSSWIPVGESAWQFKAGDLAPAACATELGGAARALEVLRTGGKYRLALGKALTSQKVKKRRDALRSKAMEVGIDLADDSIEVLTADTLARWAEAYPALAVSPLLTSTGWLGSTFSEWSSSAHHVTTWAPSASRDREIAALRHVIEDPNGQADVHVDGFSGLGKTRLVMEALRGRPYERLVVYVSAADQFQSFRLNDLQAQARTAV